MRMQTWNRQKQRTVQFRVQMKNSDENVSKRRRSTLHFNDFEREFILKPKSSQSKYAENYNDYYSESDNGYEQEEQENTIKEEKDQINITFKDVEQVQENRNQQQDQFKKYEKQENMWKSYVKKEEENSLKLQEGSLKGKSLSDIIDQYDPDVQFITKSIRKSTVKLQDKKGAPRGPNRKLMHRKSSSEDEIILKIIAKLLIQDDFITMSEVAQQAKQFNIDLSKNKFNTLKGKICVDIMRDLQEKIRTQSNPELKVLTYYEMNELRNRFTHFRSLIEPQYCQSLVKFIKETYVIGNVDIKKDELGALHQRFKKLATNIYQKMVAKKQQRK